jgi:hypothetical protein
LHPLENRVPRSIGVERAVFREDGVYDVVIIYQITITLGSITLGSHHIGCQSASGPDNLTTRGNLLSSGQLRGLSGRKHPGGP